MYISGLTLFFIFVVLYKLASRSENSHLHAEESTEDRNSYFSDGSYITSDKYIKYEKNVERAPSTEEQKAKNLRTQESLDSIYKAMMELKNNTKV